MNPSTTPEDADSILGLSRWGKGPALLWLCCRWAAAALIRPLAWELLYAMGAALQSKKKSSFDHLIIEPLFLNYNLNF